jgi:polysaccharide pyruvyl transferase WcaK-like protein
MPITLLDPSMRDHHGNSSINLGDVIIYESVQEILRSMFPDEEINRISTHTFLENKHYSQIRSSRLVFFGGTNVLSSNVKEYNQWKLSTRNLYYLFPGIKNIILLGVGWWQYQDGVSSPSSWFYKQTLHPKRHHSVRDSYTQQKLAEIGLTNVLNTACPTMWKLNGLETNRGSQNTDHCVFSLTDYKPDPDADTKLIEIILKYYSGTIYYFPQGSNDEAYINSLEIYRLNKNRIEILRHTMIAFYECVKANPGIDYIGTRLHGGTKCLEMGLKSVIIAVDNRAAEIAKDINLPVIARNQPEKLVEWLEGKSIFDPIKLPLPAIQAWKEQFT